MSVTKYRVTGKSEELRGASAPNILELGFASDADAVTFANNLGAWMGGQIVSVDNELATNYAEPYPAGTGTMVRVAAYDGVGAWQNFAVMDLKSAWVEATRAAALIASGFLIWNQQTGVFSTPAVINCAVFTPGASI